MKSPLWKIENWLFFNKADYVFEEGCYEFYSIEKSINLLGLKISLDIRYNDWSHKFAFDLWRWGFIIYSNYWFFMMNIIKERYEI